MKDKRRLRREAKLDVPFRKQIYLRTTSDWYPNFPGDRVRVSAFVSSLKVNRVFANPWAVLTISGADDDYVQRYWHFHNAHEREVIIETILEEMDFLIRHAPLNKPDLYERGYAYM